MFGIVKSITFYSKNALIATGSAVREKIIGRPKLTLVTAALFTTGYVVVPGVITAGLITSALIKARVNYIDRLKQHAFNRLSPHEKKEIDEIIKTAEIEEKLEKEITQACSPTLTAEYIKDLERNITNPLLFKISLDNCQFYLLGTHHQMSLDRLPGFAKSKILETLANPKALVVGEHEGAKALSDNFLVKIYQLSKQLFSMVRPFISIPDLVKGIVRPWYLSHSINPKLSYFWIKETQREIQKGGTFRILGWLQDFMNPGISLFFGSSGLFEDEGAINPKTRVIGMDEQFCDLRKNMKAYSLEGFNEVYGADGFKKISQLTPDQILELIFINGDIDKKKEEEMQRKISTMGLDSIKEQRIQGYLKTYRKAMCEIHDAYRSGTLDGFDIKEEIEEVVASESQKKLKEKLIQFGIAHDRKESLIARNFNWFPILLRLVRQHKEGLIFVGAGHLCSEHGLLNLFEQEGYRVERVTDDRKIELETRLISLRDKTVTLPKEKYLPLMNQDSLYLYHGVKQRKQCCGKSKVTSKNVISLNITSNGKIRLA